MQGQTPTGRATVGLLRLPGNGVVRCIGFSKAVPVPMRRRELPSRHITLMISFGEPLVVVDDDRRRSVRSFVSGLQSESAVTERLGHQHGLHVELSPLAAYSLLGLPMHTLTDVLVDLPAVLGSTSVELVERLAGAKDWPERFTLLQAALAVRMMSGPEPTPAVKWAWRRLRATHGSARIGELVQHAGLSHRHLVARFREEVGMTPKSLARVLRFEHSLTMLQQSGTTLAEVAAAAGYCDQAHLSRDFRALAGCTPGTLLGADGVRGVGSDFSKTTSGAPS
ncbi:MAG TPA: helix-turn-helix transcriptional regulator [Kribbella sp.]|nr:helix-turn-helix transcriptional regulator [Kribbella sp.]